ncbi:MAG: PAS domain-containing sensor histidine kinase [Patescibacteria group bacterium]|jgi:PAS domain S-box-containing protein
MPTTKKQPAAESGGVFFRQDDVPEALIITDPGHQILAANKVLLELLGYSENEVVGWPLEKIFSNVPSSLDRIVAGDAGVAEFEVKARTSGGKLVKMEYYATPIIRHDKVSAVLYLGRDIRVKSLVEAEIKKARNYFQSIVDNSPFGICVIDSGRRIMMFNRTAEEITGFAAAEMVGRPISELYLEAVDDAMMTPAIGKTTPRQAKFHKKNGGEVPVLVTTNLISEPGGSGNLIIESFSDQSDRQRVDQLKNEFVYVAAHELRNPVTAIRLLLDIIFEDRRLAIDPVLRGHLAKIQEANERLLHLVDDLLEVSRTEAGRLQIQVAPQNIVSHVADLLSEQRPNAVSKGVSLNYEPGSGIPYVAADSMKLKEILTNLLANAVKYNIAGGSVTVSHEVRGNKLLTKIADTGIGISEEDRKRLFQKFWRSEDLAVRAQSGTGLGLFIVKELVDRMGGEVWAESKPGSGSTFCFTLPLAG